MTLGWRSANDGADLQGTFRYVDTDRGTPGPYGSDPAGRFAGVDRTSRNLTSRQSGGGRWVQPWLGSGAVRQRTEFDMADYELTSRSSFPSEGATRRSHLRSQTDVAGSATVGFTGGVEWLGERATSTFITAGTGPVPVERSVLGLFGEARWHATSRVSLTAGVRGERIHRDALPGDPLAFTPRPDFEAETIFSVNPKVAGAWVAWGDPAVTRSWTRIHGAAGSGIRPPDAFEVAFTDNSGAAAGAQPQRGAWRRADVAGRRAPGRRHRLPQQATTTSSSPWVARFPASAGGAPTTSRTRERAGSRPRWPGGRRSAWACKPPTPGCRRRFWRWMGRHRRLPPTASAIPCCAGRGTRGPSTRRGPRHGAPPSCSCSCAERPLMPSPRSGRPAASTPIPATRS